jgi:hypothetical protein
MANLAFLFDAPMVTADDSAKTRYEAPSAEKPPSHVYTYLMAHAEPIVWYRVRTGDEWLWTRERPTAGLWFPYTLAALCNREALGREVPGIEFVQAPANEAAA